MNEKKYQLDLLIHKIKQQIHYSEEEMKKNNDQFNFYEGRKIEAELILSFTEDYKNKLLEMG